MSASTLAGAEIAALLRGALASEQGEEGLRPLRLPAWAFAQSPDPALSLMARMAAGTRLEFVSSTRRLELEVEETGLRIEGLPRLPAAFDLYADGVFHARQNAVSGPTLVADLASMPPKLAFERGTPSTLRFDGLPPGEKRLSLWLPATASVALRRLAVDPDAGVAPAPCRGRRWLHYGSSISHAMEAEGPSESWTGVVARRFGLDLVNLGLAGQCHVDGFIARVIADAAPDLVTLKLGINVVNLDTMRERAFRPAVDNFLDTLRARLPGIPIVVISPILCPVAEEAPGPTLRAGTGFRVPERPAELAYGALSLSRIRALLQDVVHRRSEAGDSALFYRDGRALFGEADVAMLPDGLHPDAKGQRLMGARFCTILEQIGWTVD